MRRPLTCPACGAEVFRPLLGARVYCQKCRQIWRFSAGPFRVGQVAGLLLGIAFLSKVGVKSDAQVMLSMTVVGVISVTCGALTQAIFAWDLEATGEYGHILHPDRLAREEIGDGEEDARPADVLAIQQPIESGHDDGRPLLVVRPERRTLEGLALGLGAVVVAIFAVYTFAEPTILRIWPGFLATRHGPEGFPVRVFIDEHALDITNESTDSWECSLSLAGLYVSTRISAGQTVAVPYARFRSRESPPDIEPDPRWMEARSSILISCTDSSGKTRWANLWGWG
jgi:hypothetical protein